MYSFPPVPPLRTFRRSREPFSAVRKYIIFLEVHKEAIEQTSKALEITQRCFLYCYLLYAV